MALRTFSSPLLRRAVAAVGIASVAVLGLSTPSGAATLDGVDKVIDTYSQWDGSSFVYEFGHPNTSTYGQVITIPAGSKKVKDFSFWMASSTGTGTMKMTGEIYGWDPATSRATTKVWSSKTKSVDFDVADPSFNEVKFKVTKAKKVKPGQQYVFFASVSKTYEETDPNVLSKWAAITTDVLPGGDVVYLNDGGDESQWTTAQWSVLGGYDFAIRAKIS